MSMETMKSGGVAMNESILNSIKSLLPIDKDITDFDGDLIVLINSSLSRLVQ